MRESEIYTIGEKGPQTLNKRQRSVQRFFFVNMWAGVVGRNLNGPYFSPDTLSGENCLKFLTPEQVLPILEDMLIVFQIGGVRHITSERYGSISIMHFSTQGW